MNTELNAVFERLKECRPESLKIDTSNFDMIVVTGEHVNIATGVRRQLKFVVTQSTPTLLTKIDGREYPVDYEIAFYVDSAKAFSLSTNTQPDLNFMDIRDGIKKIQILIRSVKNYAPADAYNFLHSFK